MTFGGPRGTKTQRRGTKFYARVFGVVEHPILNGKLVRPKSFLGGDTLRGLGVFCSSLKPVLRPQVLLLNLGGFSVTRLYGI